MSLRLGLLLALPLGVLIAYLTSLDPAGVRVTLPGGPAHDLPLLVLLVGTFLVGATLGFAVRMLREGRRDRDQRRALRVHRPETSDDPSHDGPETEGARRAGETDHTALRERRDVAAGHGRWSEALHAQERLIRAVPREERAAEETWLAGIQYELGRALLAAGDARGAASRFRDALRTRPDFLPAALGLGDARVMAGETREALRVWERALEAEPIAPLLSRLEQRYRADGRPARMIALYQGAATRHPENPAIAFGMGRAYFRLAMLNEAAEQFQKLEVQAPALPSIHAYLGAIFERHGQIREAFEEYRRALRFPEGFEWPHRCVACGDTQASWFDRCPACRRWNTARP